MNVRRHIVTGLACLAAWMAAVPTVMASGLDYTPASPNPQQIDDFLTRKNSPLAGIGAALSSYAQNYDVDPRLVVAIAGAETTFGQHQCTDNNAWNWFHRRTCPASAFTSYQEGAEHVTKYLRLSYLNRGYETIEQIRYKYCASGCDNWVSLVTSFHDAMPSNGQAAPLQQPAPTPTQPQSLQADPSRPGAPASSSPPAATDDDRIMGVPLYVVYFLGAVLVGVWAWSVWRR